MSGERARERVLKKEKGKKEKNPGESEKTKREKGPLFFSAPPPLFPKKSVFTVIFGECSSLSHMKKLGF